MTTNELIKRMELMNFKIKKETTIKSKEIIIIFSDSVDSNGMIAWVAQDEMFRIDNYFLGFSKLTISEKSIVFNTLIEYACTPINER